MIEDIPIDAFPAGAPMNPEMTAWMLFAIACIVTLLWLGGLDE